MRAYLTIQFYRIVILLTWMTSDSGAHMPAHFPLLSLILESSSPTARSSSPCVALVTDACFLLAAVVRHKPGRRTTLAAGASTSLSPGVPTLVCRRPRPATPPSSRSEQARGRSRGRGEQRWVKREGRKRERRELIGGPPPSHGVSTTPRIQNYPLKPLHGQICIVLII